MLHKETRRCRGCFTTEQPDRSDRLPEPSTEPERWRPTVGDPKLPPTSSRMEARGLGVRDRRRVRDRRIAQWSGLSRKSIDPHSEPRLQTVGACRIEPVDRAGVSHIRFHSLPKDFVIFWSELCEEVGQGRIQSSARIDSRRHRELAHGCHPVASLTHRRPCLPVRVPPRVCRAGNCATDVACHLHALWRLSRIVHADPIDRAIRRATHLACQCPEGSSKDRRT